MTTWEDSCDGWTTSHAQPQAPQCADDPDDEPACEWAICSSAEGAVMGETRTLRQGVVEMGVVYSAVERMV